MQRVQVSLYVIPRHSTIRHMNDYCIGNSKLLTEDIFKQHYSSLLSLLFQDKELVTLCKRQKTREREGKKKHTCFSCFIIAHLNSLQYNSFFQLPKIKSWRFLITTQELSKKKIKINPILQIARKILIYKEATITNIHVLYPV